MHQMSIKDYEFIASLKNAISNNKETFTLQACSAISMDVIVGDHDPSSILVPSITEHAVYHHWLSNPPDYRGQCFIRERVLSLLDLSLLSIHLKQEKKLVTNQMDYGDEYIYFLLFMLPP